MRRSTALTAQLKAQSSEGTELHFERSVGGYFSTDPAYALKVMGRTRQTELTGENLFPLGDLENQSDWTISGFDIMGSDEVAEMLEPLTTYTLSFDAECVKVPAESIICNSCFNFETGDYAGCGTLGLILEHSGLGFVLVPSDACEPEYGLGLPYENSYPLINMFVKHQIGEGEKYHGVVTFTTPESLDGYTLQVLTNQYFYSHYDHPEICYSTVTFTNIKIEKGSVATPYVPYGEENLPSETKCVKAGSTVICGESSATVPCDLFDGDVWYPMTGVVERNSGKTEQYTPQGLKMPAGEVSVTQEPLELQARLSATILTKRTTLNESLTWKDIQSIVRCGLAPCMFEIGDQLTCNHETYGELVWDIIGFDCDVPSDASRVHSMTLQLHDCIAGDMQFDAREALYYAESKLAPGTYNFSVVTQPLYAEDSGKTFQFTLTQAVPAGGQIVLDMTNGSVAVAGTTVSTYGSAASTETIESAVISEGTEGTSLGTADGSAENLNHIQRAIMGSNNWGQSAIRQFLNSDGEAGSVWVAQTVFDRPPTWTGATDGFLCGMDADFLSVIGKSQKTTALNIVTDGDGEAISEDSFFLLSRTEVYGGKESGTSEGVAYPYYSDNSDLSATGTTADTNRIKYREGVAVYWWLRSPNSPYAYYARRVHTSGVVNHNSAVNTQSVAPACCII